MTALLAATALPFTATAAAAQTTFTVDSNADAVDATPGDGTCATSNGTCTLRAAVQEANAFAGADTIVLPAGEFAIAIPPLNQNDITSGDFDITEDLTITGAGQSATTIDGGVPKAGSGAEIPGLDRLFAVAPGVGSVSLSELRLQEGYAQEFGGAVLNEGDATVQLTNVTVANNLAGKNGGGVDNHANGTIAVSGSTFTANSSIEGGSALNNNRAGTLTVTSSTLTNNHGGSAILNNGEFDVHGTITVTDSTISDNDSGEFELSGGGINNAGGTLTVERTTFSGNASNGYGGGLANNGGAVLVTDSTFTANRGDAGGGFGGGDLGGSAEIRNSTFTGNHAEADGGALANDGPGTLIVTDGRFIGNIAEGDGGAIVNNGFGAVTITGVTFSDNTGANGGGLANNADALVDVATSTFIGNHALSEGLGGAGGAIQNDSDGQFSLRDSTLRQNDGDSGGGFANHGDGAVEITNTTISANTASADGGGLAIDSGAVAMTNIDVLGNTAGANGGGISFAGDKIAKEGETATITGSRINDNVANEESGSGGGIDSQGDGELGITDTTVRNNRAFAGGAIHHVGDAPLTINRSTITGNHADSGGGLFLEGDAGTTVTNSTVSANTATSFGGGMLANSTRADLVHVTVTDNNAASGGGISNGGADLTGDGFVLPRNTIIANNPTGGNCGGTLDSQGSNLENADTCGLRAEGDQINVDPRLGPLADNGGPTLTHALQAGSPALNNANVAPFPATDQRGVTRPQGLTPDIGAFESETPGCTGTLETTADIDSWLAENNPTANFGADAVLKVRSKSAEGNLRALVRFALPDAGGCQVVDAKLRLHASSATPGRTLEAVAVDGSWTESEVTWANQPTTAGPAATTDSGLGTLEWTVTEQVQAMYTGANNGFLIKDSQEGDPAGPEQQFHGHAKAPDQPPQLIITFG
ncbi:MAG: DNRLRE domain-containing protein [Pseudonocardiales bacterium]